MKIFQAVQKRYAVVGISSTNQSTPKLPFNKRILLGFVLFGHSIVLQFKYLFYVASGFVGHVESICSICGTVIIFISFTAITLKKVSLFEVIDAIEKLIDTSKRILNFKWCKIIRRVKLELFVPGNKYPKSKRFFLKTNRQVERLSEIVFTVVMKVFLQCFLFPKCVVSFGVYFFTDSGRDSFQLPFPMWWILSWKDQMLKQLLNNFVRFQKVPIWFE